VLSLKTAEPEEVLRQALPVPFPRLYSLTTRL